MKFKFILAILLVLLFAGVPDLAAYVTYVHALGNNIELISVSDNGTGNNDSLNPSITYDGRYVTFESYASNLVPNDTNGPREIFVRDRQTTTTAIVSIASDSIKGNSNSYIPVISDDGRYVAFYSEASNLVPNDTNGYWDTFVHDRQANITSRISIAFDGTQANNDSCCGTAISDNGRFVAFDSLASNLVPNDTNGHTDVFVRDRQTTTTAIVSIASDGTKGNNLSTRPCISGDGRYVTFHSWSNNLVSDDTNDMCDIFVHDRQANTTTRVSIASDNTQANNGSFSPSVSDDGRYITFCSHASNLVPNDTNVHLDVFVRDRQTNTTEIVSVASNGTQGNNDSFSYSISSDGRYVAFSSYASNLVPNDTNNSSDVFVRDRQMNTTAIVSVASDGALGNNHSWKASISGDGHYVAFDSYASNLVPNDTNNSSDVFVADNPLNPPPPPPPPSPAPPSPLPSETYTNEEYCFSLQYPGNWVEAPELMTSPYHLAAFRVPNFVPGVIIAALDADAAMSEGWIIKSFKDMGIKDLEVLSPLTDTMLSNGIKAHTYKIGYIIGLGYQASAFCLDADRCDKRIRVMVYTVDAFLPYNESLFSEIVHTLTFTCTCAPPETQTPPSSPHASPSLPHQLNQAQISLQYLNVNPEQAQVNQPLTISGNVVNTGDQAGNYYLNLKINGKVEQTRMVSVGPQTSQPVKFTITKSQPGTYTIDIGGQRSSFTVIGENQSSGSSSRGGVIAILAISILIMATIVILLLNRRTAQ
jgi:hypothetical protein